MFTNLANKLGHHLVPSAHIFKRLEALDSARCIMTTLRHWCRAEPKMTMAGGSCAARLCARCIGSLTYSEMDRIHGGLKIVQFDGPDLSKAF